MRMLFLAIAAAMLLVAPARAGGEPPSVVVSIPPLHALVAGVMEGVGQPYLLVPAGASPHAQGLRPADARRLELARVVFWLGEPLEAFLVRPLRTLPREAEIVALIEAEGLILLPPRDGIGSGIDPHVWLDPVNAIAMVRAMAQTLARVDPPHGRRYDANATRLIARIEGLDRDLATLLAPVRRLPYVVFHDAYGYFEDRYELASIGAVALDPGRTASARRVADIRQRLRDGGALCVFTEPQFEPRLIATLTEGTAARVGVLDPLGVGSRPGADAYFELMTRLATSLRDCLLAAR